VQNSDPERLAALCRALAHPTRVRILELLAQQAECRGAEVFGELPLAQSTISEHLRVLKDAGVVSARPVGTSMVYCIVREAVEQLRDALGEIAETTPACEPVSGGSR